MSTGRKIVVVGGGPAGVAAALAAKQQDAAADVLLLNDEHCEPYEKPPLSKAVLIGKVAAHDAPIAGPKGVAGGGVALKPGTRATEIDRGAREVVTDAGERIGYDALVLATGSINRELAMFPAQQKGIYYLRTEADARALKAHLHQSRSLLVVGGGLIGLEVAASAAELGVKTTVIEIAPRILARVCDPETSALIHDAPPRRRRRYPHRHRHRRVARAAGRTARGRNQGRRHHHGRSHRGRDRRRARRSAGEGGGARHPGRHHRRRPRPQLRPDHLRGRRLHPLPRPARAGAAGELAPCPGARRRCRPQCGGRRRRLCGGAVVLVRAVRLVYPGGGLADPAAEREGAPSRSVRTRRCCSSSTARGSPMRRESTRSATSRWRGD